MATKLILVSVLLVLSTIVARSEDTLVESSRILGGNDASSGYYPWVASIRSDGGHVCMGSIISNRYIITAAHCISSIENDQITARLGSTNQFAAGQIVRIENVISFPMYGSFLHDIALLKVNQTLTFSDKINKIELADAEDIIADGATVSACGWGLQENGSSPYKLKHVLLNALGTSECDELAGFGYDSVLCLAHPENIGLCPGDYGAGIVSDTKLVGIASFSFGKCGSKLPDISSRISYYSEWINNIIEK